MESTSSHQVKEEVITTLLDFDFSHIEYAPSRGKAFEQFIKNIFLLAGYNSYITKKNANGNDGGSDVIAEKDNKYYVIQCKVRNPTSSYKYNSVSRLEVDTFYGNYCDIKEKKTALEVRGIFVTTGYFFPSTRAKYQNKEQFYLYDRRDLMQLIAKMIPDVLAEAFYRKISGAENGKLCNKCHAQIIQRCNSQDKKPFSACSQYCTNYIEEEHP